MSESQSQPQFKPQSGKPQFSGHKLDFSVTARASSASPAASETLDAARSILTLECEAILAMRDRISPEFEQAIELLHRCAGKVVVTGMGKSGHIAGKIAATLASTGTPAFFVHPAELRHGDFGMMDEKDVVIALSGSGETQEVTLVLDPIRRAGLKLIALTGNLSSTLARIADVVLDVGVETEACPLNLAPTSSTTAALAMGDALAIVLMTQKGFQKEDFARSHPGGNLGKMLITVKDVMRSGVEVPKVSTDAEHKTILEEIDSKRLGFTCVLDGQDRLQGIITDGDLRRSLIKWGPEMFQLNASQLMTANPKTIAPDCLAVAALKLMEKHSISDLLILDEQSRPVGLIDLKDLLKAGII